MSHYISDFTSRRHTIRLAVCGKLIDTREHSPEPDCEKCSAWVDADEKEAATLAARWDEEAEAERIARIRPMTRQEKLQALADRGTDTWAEYRGER